MYKKKSASKSVKKAMGFVCPVCGHRHGYALNRPGRYRCARCRHQTFLTANTVMHRTHLPLTNW